jgi:hypothetical protein
MNVHVPGQDIQTVRVVAMSLMHSLTDNVQGYTWFGSIIGVLVGFGAIGSFLTYRLIVSR